MIARVGYIASLALSLVTLLQHGSGVRAAECTMAELAEFVSMDFQAGLNKACGLDASTASTDMTLAFCDDGTCQEYIKGAMKSMPRCTVSGQSVYDSLDLALKACETIGNDGIVDGEADIGKDADAESEADMEECSMVELAEYAVMYTDPGVIKACGTDAASVFNTAEAKMSPFCKDKGCQEEILSLFSGMPRCTIEGSYFYGTMKKGISECGSGSTTSDSSSSDTSDNTHSTSELSECTTDELAEYSALGTDAQLAKLCDFTASKSNTIADILGTQFCQSTECQDYMTSFVGGLPKCTIEGKSLHTLLADTITECNIAGLPTDTLVPSDSAPEPSSGDDTLPLPTTDDAAHVFSTAMTGAVVLAATVAVLVI